MIHVPITLSENTSTNRILEPTRVSIPFASGVLFNPDDLLLVNDLQASLVFQHSILAYWPNGSIKWLSINFQASLNANNNAVYHLTSRTDLHSSAEPHTAQIALEETLEKININTGKAQFSLFKKEFGLMGYTKNQQHALASENNSIVLTDLNSNRYTPKIENITCEQTNGAALSQLVTINGRFQPQINTENCPSSPLTFSASLTFYAGKSFVETSITLHNPQSMVHNGGKWDLGNEHSVFFESFELHLQQNLINSIQYQTNRQHEMSEVKTQPFAITQVSSGGENWKSTNHMNHQGEVLLPFKGYQITSNNQIEEVADRASPLVKVYTEEHNLSLYIHKFWQNFPTQIALDNNKITLSLFPKLAHEQYELQPGERKTHSFIVDYLSESNEQSSATVDFAESPIQTILSPQYLAQTHALPLFAEQNQDTELNSLIDLGLTSSNNFFQKREVIDEFGWRNFGDIYADHEALSYQGESELISHYNNQYDPLYGFLRQYLLTSEKQWLELANDLAAHITDIDIYHTTEDRDEYNGGLFWHTDHYLPAETATHRTYSKRQSANAYQDHAGGGGPGGQHCYTTGLMLHYFITGKTSSKEAVLTLSHWITHVYEGSATLGDFLLAIKNKNRIDLKNIFTGKYPLDRGTANYIIALLDSFELTGQQSFIDNASLVIKNTVHPNDDIAIRNLKNVEECWFYTVFLQAVGRFLQLKETHEQRDESFHYARNALLHYVQWMLKNETPYLDKPEILEYPNHTWAAQDLRKANIFYIASCFASNTEQQQAFHHKGDEFYRYVTSTLQSEPTRDFSRILSLLMQNHGAKSYCIQKLKAQNTISCDTPKDFIKEEIAPFKSLLNAFCFTLSNTCLSSELNWLRKRVTKVDDLLIKLGR